MSESRLELGIVRLERGGATDERQRLIGPAQAARGDPRHEERGGVLGLAGRRLPGRAEGLFRLVFLKQHDAHPDLRRQAPRVEIEGALELQLCVVVGQAGQVDAADP
jgi:hypothetical protein